MFDDLGWKGFEMIRLEIEHEFLVHISDGVSDLWTSVADVIEATERAVKAQQRQRAA